MRRWIIIAAVIVAAVLAWRVFAAGDASEQSEYRFSVIDRGDVVRAVSATGRLEPVGTVEIGSQLSGEVSEVLVDYNDRVEAGQVIARLDPDTFEQRALVAAADLDVQRANLAAAEAQLVSAQAELRDAERQYARQQELRERGISAEAALDTALSARDRARASVSTAEANITVATARVAQAEAALAGAEIDVERTHIRAPVNGVVVDRTVEVGQTVAASLQAPILFTIAEDLSRMQVEIQVDEADIGEIRESLPVRFTVDAFMERQFAGEVTQVRMQPLIESNVVTYTVIAETANARGQLLPGMTANVEIVLEERSDVLRAPNAALRWRALEGEGRGRGARGAPSGAARGGGGGPGGRLTAMIERLDLSEEQTARVQPMVETAQREMRAAFMAARESGDRAGVREAMRETLQTLLADIEPVLTPQQVELLSEIRAEAAARRGGGGRPGVVWILSTRGQPAPVRVRLGASDAERTEIVEVLEGELADGDQVITGGGEVEAAPAPRRGGGRMRRFP